MKTVSKALALLSASAALYAAPRAEACSISNAANWSDEHVAIATQFDAATVNMSKNQGPNPFSPTIIGLWKFTFVAQGNPAPLPPDGTVLDAGFQTWHVDNTELMNSSRPAATGDFCMGVWRQQGASYILNHFAMAWNAPGQTPEDFAGIANIREQVRLGRDGNTFTGPATLDQYEPDGETVAVHLAGIISATRVTINSTVSGH